MLSGPQQGRGHIQEKAASLLGSGTRLAWRQASGIMHGPQQSVASAASDTHASLIMMYKLVGGLSSLMGVLTCLLGAVLHRFAAVRLPFCCSFAAVLQRYVTPF